MHNQLLQILSNNDIVSGKQLTENVDFALDNSVAMIRHLMLI
jgi:hypothetical protein